ncbi:hypothetical protein CBA19CS11_35810 [Caballeronia novacaledonica]|uniref:hypothetical protein n=1 Tax=Caballeronia novacaledonica TaxID=1544861 RepID=UPI001EE196F9|nr:hypothetical protein [Caballeronia novacaledonica]GJH14322.1 hypothetical protein CBA19CS11_35810 [Caballeronia novacaledonica]
MSITWLRLEGTILVIAFVAPRIAYGDVPGLSESDPSVVKYRALESESMKTPEAQEGFSVFERKSCAALFKWDDELYAEASKEAVSASRATAGT